MSAKSYAASDFQFCQKVPDTVSPHGHVCLAWMKSVAADEEKLVVVKSLRQSLAAKADESFSNADAKCFAKYKNEADNLRKLGDSFPWLNQFYGYTLYNDAKGRLAALLVWEFIPSMGPVIEVLEAADRLCGAGNGISFALKCDWMRRLLKTTQFLHEQKALNGNLKSRNVFIDENFGVKLTDFSTLSWFDLESVAHPSFQSRVSARPVAVDLEERSGMPSTLESYSSGFPRKDFKLSLPYLSLQRLKGEVSSESDLYSFGVVCWEIAMGSFVDARRTFDEVLNGANLDSICRSLNGLFDRRQLSPYTPAEVLEMIHFCGVGRLGKSNQSSDIDDMCQRYEQKLAVLSMRLGMDKELYKMRNLNMKTDHMRRIEQCLQEQRLRRDRTQEQQRHQPQRTVQQESLSNELSVNAAAPSSIPRNLSSRSLPSDAVSTERPSSAEPDLVITSTPSAPGPSLHPNGFQQLVMNPDHVRGNQLQPRGVATQGYDCLDYSSGGSNVKIMAQNIPNPTFIQNSNVVINSRSAIGDVVQPKERPKADDPISPPPGTLTENGDEIDRGDEKILRTNYLAIEKWEKLARNLGLTDGEVSDLKMRHKGLGELNCRLLEKWKEKESTEATKKKFAIALWMADEKDLATRIQ